MHTLSVRVPHEDFLWLAGFAQQENLSAAALTRHAVWVLRMWEEKGKDAIEEVLDGVDALCREHDQELQQLRHYYEQRQVTPPQPEPTQPYGPKVARLLALAVSTDSKSEARAALEKARELHRPTAKPS